MSPPPSAPGIVSPSIDRRCGDLRRPDGRHCLECRDLAGGHSFVFLACADRRPGRRRTLQRRLESHRLAGPGQDRRRHRSFACSRIRSRLLLVLVVSWTFLKASPFWVDGVFRHVQFLSASAYSLGHGGNDAQKTMGIIAALLFAHGVGGRQFPCPLLGGAGLSGRDGAGHPVRRLAHCTHHGLADHPSDAHAGRVRGNRRGASPCSAPPIWACRFPPPTPSPAPLSGSARRGASRRYAGTWPRTLWSPGSSPCRQRA